MFQAAHHIYHSITPLPSAVSVVILFLFRLLTLLTHPPFLRSFMCKTLKLLPLSPFPLLAI